MSHQEIFIGREKELKMIDEMVFDPTGARHVLRIVGEGGVGKTWLLREIYRRYEQDQKVIVIRIDYGEVRTQSLPSLARYFLEQFSDHVSETQREEFYHQLSNLESGLETYPNIMHEKEYGTYISGINIINSEVSKDKRIVILSDTAEVTKFPEFQIRINNLASNLQNSIVIIAGRATENVKKRFAMYPDIYKSWHVHRIYDLKSFSNSETTQYFEVALPASLPTDLRDQIFVLTGGNPVLISITGEWLKRHIALPADVALPLEELQALNERQLAQRREHFEFALVERMHDLRKPIEWALLYLAFLNRRYDPEILRLTLDLSDDELAEVTEELKSMVFVRQSISSKVGLLHDEAQRLILVQAWPVADLDGGIRREIAQQVIDEYYLPKIKCLSEIVQAKVAESVAHKVDASESQGLAPIPDEDWLKRELQIECLDYHFRTDMEQGWAYLDQLITEAENYHYSLIQVDAIEQGMHNLYLEWFDPVRFKVRLARILLHKKEVERAIERAQEALDSAEIIPAEAEI